jgi:hypothetical protein
MAEKKKAEKKDGTPRAPRSPSVAPEVFVAEWQKCESLADAREKLGNGASSRAQRLRKAGVKLRAFAPGRHPIDVKALNALIK